MHVAVSGGRHACRPWRRFGRGCVRSQCSPSPRRLPGSKSWRPGGRSAGGAPQSPFLPWGFLPSPALSSSRPSPSHTSQPLPRGGQSPGRALPGVPGRLRPAAGPGPTGTTGFLESVFSSLPQARRSHLPSELPANYAARHGLPHPGASAGPSPAPGLSGYHRP
jgi:hypothetical protein